MTVENAAHRVGDRVVVIVAINEHRDDGGDRAGTDCARPGAFQELWQVGEDRGGIAARHRRFAGASRHLAQRMGVAGD